jgi:hypothetical protein
MTALTLKTAPLILAVSAALCLGLAAGWWLGIVGAAVVLESANQASRS